MRRIGIILVAVVATMNFSAVLAGDGALDRGRYLVTIAGCNDCHTPGALMGAPDTARRLAGSDVGFGDPASGVWVGGNLTPDPETGLGRWSKAQIVAAITRGESPDGRVLSEVMPWPALSHLTPEDADAVAAYLQSLPPIKNLAPGPFKPGEAPGLAVSVVLPPSEFAKLPNPMPAK